MALESRRGKRILIVGATGRTGKILLPQLLSHGNTVTALVRDKSQLTIVHPRLITIEGSVRDPAVVTEAMLDQQVVISMLANRAPGEVTIFSHGTRVLADAAQAEGVKRFITVSAIPVGLDPEEMPIAHRILMLVPQLASSFTDMERMEADLMSREGLDWTIVRPGVLADALSKTVRIEVGDTVEGGLTTSRYNLAGLLLQLVESDDFIGDKIAITD